MTYYDREADIVYVELQDVETARSVEHDWGLLDFGDDGQAVGIEYWDASDHLPADLLSALPAPKPAVKVEVA